MLRRHDAIENIHSYTGGRELRGKLGVPQGPVGLVVVAGLGDPHVAEALRARGLATLVINIPAIGDLDDLARDMLAITDYVVARTTVSHLPIGYLGADCYAAAAVIAASHRPELIRAIVAFGGRIDLAGAALSTVRAPTLLISERDDEDLIERDREAIELMVTTTQLAIIPGAFYDASLLDEVVQVSAEWLVDHFGHALPEPAARRGSWGRKFRDRRNAGERLAAMLTHHTDTDAVVFGLPRGGVIVADEIARALHVPLDVWLVRKIGMPIQPDLGMGALAEGATLVLDPTIVRWSGATNDEVQDLVHRKVTEIRRSAALYREGSPAPDVRGKTVILVDDGVATGGTLAVAVRGARKRGARRVVVAAPIASAKAVEILRADADELACLATPHHLLSVASWYQDFRPVSEQDVVTTLHEARARRARAA